MKAIYLYKFEVTFWDVFDEETKTDKGIVAGTSYSNAVTRVDSIYTPENGHTEIISISIEELDAYDGAGTLFLFDIKEVFKEDLENV